MQRPVMIEYGQVTRRDWRRLRRQFGIACVVTVILTAVAAFAHREYRLRHLRAIEGQLDQVRGIEYRVYGRQERWSSDYGVFAIDIRLKRDPWRRIVLYDLSPRLIHIQALGPYEFSYAPGNHKSQIKGGLKLGADRPFDPLFLPGDATVQDLVDRFDGFCEAIRKGSQEGLVKTEAGEVAYRVIDSDLPPAGPFGD